MVQKYVFFSIVGLFAKQTARKAHPKAAEQMLQHPPFHPM
jgi:hypothetical protein